MTLPARAENPSRDADLVAAVAGGDLAALGALYDRFERDVRRLVRRLGVPPADADDLVQATFLELMRAAVRFDAAFGVRPWLLGVAAMLARRHRRSAARLAARLAAFTMLDRTESAADPGAALDERRTAERAERALQALSAKKREAFVLVVLEGLRGEDAARALGIPVATVWTRVHHARRELRRRLREAP